LNEDFRDLLGELLETGARFLVVGAHAMAVHGVPRATGDLDVWVRPDPSNADRVWQALARFGAPMSALDVAPSDLAHAGTVVQIGLPPRRVDVLTGLSGLDFDAAWKNRKTCPVGGREVPFLGRDDLIRNKRASGRPKDLADLEVLERGEP
jgi:hypothetical protein